MTNPKGLRDMNHKEFIDAKIEEVQTTDEAHHKLNECGTIRDNVYIGHSYDLTGVLDWDAKNPGWDLKQRPGFMSEQGWDDERLSEIKYIIRIKVRGHDYAVFIKQTMWSRELSHMEFFGSRFGPISGTGYRSNFFGLSEEELGVVNNLEGWRKYVLDTAELIIEEEKPKKSKKKKQVEFEAEQMELSLC